ncbi:MAG TPA: glycosyltransferase family A protein, partial [Solirubrobacteraceae bacterium]|nr:glycosyltransferase family A protein [Solirubrobacteraceae bacterium]
EDAVVSALAQTHPCTEVIVVNDGSMFDADWVLGEIASRHPIAVVTQLNSGLGAARNFGISQARGRFIVPLDADNMLEPTFVERALEVIERDPRTAFVTSWSRYIDELGESLPAPNLGYQPIGNASPEVLLNNVAGDAVALLRRRLFDAGFAYSEDLTSYEDWQLYQQFHRAGLYGIVIPERLVRYRVRADSMIRQIGFPQTDRLSGELEAHRREREVQWTLVRG